MKLFLTSLPLGKVGRSDVDHTVAHRTVMGVFESGMGPNPRSQFGVLFRIEPEFARILVQSQHPPLPSQIEALGGQTKAWEAAEIPASERVRYRIDIAALRRTGKAEKRIPASDIGTWWIGVARQHGLELEGAVNDHVIGLRDARRASVALAQPRLRIARISGIARVIEPARLHRAITQGLGRSRAYGCGLLSVTYF